MKASLYGIGLLLLTTAANAACLQSQSQAFTLLFGVETPPPNGSYQTIPLAHTDIELPLRFSLGWDAHIKTDWPAANTRIETSVAFFDVNSSYRLTLPFIPLAYAFIGAMPNEPFWYYDPQYAPGFDSQDMSAGELNALCVWNPNAPAKGAASNQKWLAVQLLEVVAPAGGKLSMFDQSDPPMVFFATSDGIDANDIYYIVAKNHSHMVWTFTQPGLYQVKLRVATYYVCNPTLQEDRNGDCVVDLADFALFASQQWLPEGLMAFVNQWLDCDRPFESECP